MSVPYRKRTIKQLKLLLRERGYKGYSSLKKDELIVLLQNKTPVASIVVKPYEPVGDEPIVLLY